MMCSEHSGIVDRLARMEVKINILLLVGLISVISSKGPYLALILKGLIK